MSYNFFKQELKSKTDTLSFKEATIFSAFNCERIINLYELICIQYGVGDYDMVKGMLDFIWKKIINENLKNVDLEKKLQNIQQLVPDSEKYHGINNALALNVIICLDVCYKCITKQTNDSYLTSLYIYDSIRQMILSKSTNIKFITKEIISKIDESKVVKNEIKKSLTIIDLITTTQINEKIIDSIREKAILNRYNLKDIEPLD